MKARINYPKRDGKDKPAKEKEIGRINQRRDARRNHKNNSEGKDKLRPRFVHRTEGPVCGLSEHRFFLTVSARRPAQAVGTEFMSCSGTINTNGKNVPPAYNRTNVSIDSSPLHDQGQLLQNCSNVYGGKLLGNGVGHVLQL